MRRIYFVKSVLLIFFICIIYGDVLAWDNKVTHRDLSKYAANSSILRFCNNAQDQNCDYLKNIGLDKGLTNIIAWDGSSTIKQGKIEDWLREGAYLEDAGSNWQGITGVARYTNHFHNPLKPWETAGLTDLQSGESSLKWAQDSAKQKISLLGDWSWQAIRGFFFNALTKSTDSEKQAYFAQTFRGLGHQMHLIQDMSNPAHVRNDAHPIDGMGGLFGMMSGLETWAKKHTDKINSFALTPFALQLAFNTSQDGYAPITQFIDTDQYIMGSAPSTSPAWGISEYTNSNFVSDDTIFTENFDQGDKHYFPYPRYSTQCYQLVESTDGITSKKRTYLSKVCDGENIQRFAVAGPLFKFFGFAPSLQRTTFKLDPGSFYDYAQKLIPRAVGYSAGLLNYFFRGSLEISVPDSYVYSITDGSKTPYIIQGAPSPHQQFTHIRAKVRNTTPKDVDPNGNPLTYEDMTTGSLQAVARYKIIPNYMPDLSNDPPDGTAMDAVSYSYSVSAPISISSLGSTDSTEYIFDFTTNPIPAGITDLYLNVVFKGTLGGEKDIAVAVGMKDLMEPTHFALWNLTDMFSLDYHMYTWDQIMAAPNLAGRIDLNHNGTCCETGEPYIKPYGIDYQIGFTGDPALNAVTVASVNQLPPGRYIRLIGLVDADLGENYAQVVWSDPLDNDATKFNIFFEGATYEDDEDGWIDTPAETFRLARQHFHSGTIRCIPLAYDQQGVGHCVYNEAEAIPANLEPVGLDIIFP